MPAEIVEVVPARPSPAHVWVKGHHVFEGGRWVWQPGRLGPHVIRVKQYSPAWREAAGWHRGGNRDLQVVDFTEALPDYLRLPAMTAKLRQFLADESGATAIEYSLIAGGIALAIIATVKGIGPKLNTTFSSISSQLK
jgi:pilus assembly protein Flp/PilA